MGNRHSVNGEEAPKQVRDASTRMENRCSVKKPVWGIGIRLTVKRPRNKSGMQTREVHEKTRRWGLRIDKKLTIYYLLFTIEDLQSNAEGFPAGGEY